MDEDDRQWAEYHQWTLEQQQQEEELKKAQYEPFLTAYFSDFINNIMKENRMAQTNLELSIDIACRIAKILNDEILKTGEIQINNKTIWDGMLHQMDNEIWRGILDLLEELNAQSPSMLTLQDLRNIRDAGALLDKYEQYYDRVLDMKSRHVDAKKTAWRALMTTREVVCRCWNLDLPNSDKSKVLSNYGSLFE